MKESFTQEKLLVILSVLLKIDDIEIIKCVIESLIEEFKDSEPDNYL
jgi:hypothetical protein